MDSSDAHTPAALRLDQIPVALLWLQPDGTVSALSAEAEELLGCSAEAVRSKPLSSLLHAPARGCRFNSVEEMLATLQANDGKRVTGAFLMKRAMGNRRVIEVTCQRFSSGSAEDATVAVLRDVSELSERVAEAQRNEARFRSLSHALSDYAYVLRVDERRRVQLEWATPALLDVLDIQAAELETRIAWGRRIPRYEREKVVAHLRKILANKSDAAEFRIVGKDREVRWIANRAQPHYDEQLRRVTYIYGAAHDITERKRVEEELKRSNEWLNSVFEASRDGIIVEEDERIVYTNSAAVQLYGYSAPQELIGKHVSLIQSEQDNERMLEYGRKRKRGEPVPTVYEFKARRKDGTLFDCEISASAAVIGSKTAIIGVLRDITGRKRAEQALKESEERFRTVAIQTRQLVYDYNPITGAIAWAGAIERLTGFTDEEFQEFDIRRWEEHIHPDDRRQALQLLDQAMRSGEEYRAEYRFRRKDGSYIVVEDNGVFFYEKGGKPYRMLGTMADVTDRKREESLRLRLSQVLESIAGDEALPEILERLVRAIEEYQPDMKGSVLLLDMDGKRLRHGAAPSLPESYNAAVDGLLIGPRVGSCGTAAYEKRLVIVEDTLTDPLWADYRDLAAKHGLSACWSQPIIDHEGAVLGTLAMYYQRPRKPAAAELELISTAANIAGIAIKRKRAEEALRHSELRYRTVVANAPVVLWALDREGKFTFSEGKGLERLGLKPGEVVGRSVFEVYRDIPEIVENNRQALEGKTITSVIEVGGISFESHYAPLYGDRGEVIGAIGLAIDITERKRAEEALKKSEERYRFLYDGTPSMFFTLDEHATIISVNNFGATYLGYRVDELVGSSVLNIFHEADHAAVAEALQQCLRNPGATYTVRFRKRHKDGSVLWIEETACAVQVPGQCLQVLVVCTDISERVRMEVALRESEERYRAFFEDDLTGDYISKPDGTLLECNPAFVKMFGFASREQALATPATVLYSDPKKREEFIQRVRTQKRLEYLETELRRVDGSPLYAIENVAGIFDERGELVMLRGYLFDDTKRRLLEQHLIQAQKLDSLGTLASGVAHDFNNILSIVVGHGSLLKRHAHHDQTVARHADAILSATERGVGLVRQILTFARRTESAFEELNVHALIHEHVKLLSETFPKTIEIVLDLTSETALIEGDTTQIHQVLLNLSVNARDAMPHGGKLTISTRVVPGSDLSKRFPEASARPYIQLGVSDTGIGMDEQTQQKVFEPFFTTKDRTKGTGLGLSVVYGVVQSHNGFIELRSAPGQGTVFSLYFPLLRKTFGTAEHAHEVAVEDLRGSETLLLVEDEEMLLALMNDLLTAQGYHVLAAPDSETALRLYRKQHSRIDAVISDFGLPKFNGLELYRRLRSINPNVRMMIASGFIEPETKDLMLEEGILHVLAKPYRPDEVLRLLRKMFAP